MFEDFRLFPPSASAVSGEVDALYFFLVAVSLVFGTGIALALTVFAVRFRRRAGRRAEQIEGSTKLEILWSVVPLVIAMVMFGWGTKVYVDIVSPPPEGMQLYVTGKQWMWKIQHPTGQREINALHVPVGENVLLTMTSEDVIHDFYVPAFRMKMDVLPGRYSTAWFRATKTGRFHLFCAEYCGTKHSEMIGEVVVMEPLEYERWLTGQPFGVTPEQAGLELFGALRCDTCHGERAGARGPALKGLYGRDVRLGDGSTVLFDADYVRESILEPNAKLTAGYQPLMPTYAGQVSEEQVLQLVAYLKSLAETEGSR
jgi:cytochrome c oxidase subunit 2